MWKALKLIPQLAKAIVELIPLLKKLIEKLGEEKEGDDVETNRD